MAFAYHTKKVSGIVVGQTMRHKIRSLFSFSARFFRHQLFIVIENFATRCGSCAICVVSKLCFQILFDFVTLGSRPESLAMWLCFRVFRGVCISQGDRLWSASLMLCCFLKFGTLNSSLRLWFHFLVYTENIFLSNWNTCFAHTETDRSRVDMYAYLRMTRRHGASKEDTSFYV